MNILFDGCSWTKGTELKNKERDRFSTLVSKDTGNKHVNLGEGGKSNDGILRTTINYCETHKVDFAIIQFTKIQRREILNADIEGKHTKDGYFCLKATNKDKVSRSYFANLNTQEDDIANYYKNKFLLEKYFYSNLIPFFFLNLNRNVLTTKPSSWQTLSETEPVACLYDILQPDLEYFGIEQIREEKLGEIGKIKGFSTHPNAKGHRKIADYIINQLESRL